MRIYRNGRHKCRPYKCYIRFDSSNQGTTSAMSRKVQLARYSGFCFGVRRAIRLAQDAVKSKNNIYSLGPLMHNRQEVERLEKKGIHAVEKLSEIKSGTVIIRSHGVHPRLMKEAKKKGLSVIDATCPFVKKVQKLTALLQKEGYKVIVVGEKDHPEILALPGVKVVEKVSDVEKMRGRKKLGVVSQTTQTIEDFSEIVSALVKKTPELVVFNTICGATVRRQRETYDLACTSDLMLVVGGYNSANTRRLAEICKRSGTETHHIETADEIKPSWLKGKNKIGVTAGASTPKWIIRKMVARLQDLTKCTI